MFYLRFIGLYIFFHYPLSPSPCLLLLFHPSLYFPIFILFSTLSPMPLCLPFVLLLLQQLLLVLLRLKTSLELDENSPRHHSGIFCRLGTACGIRSSQLSQNIQAASMKNNITTTTPRKDRYCEPDEANTDRVISRKSRRRYRKGRQVRQEERLLWLTTYDKVEVAQRAWTSNRLTTLSIKTKGLTTRNSPMQ